MVGPLHLADLTIVPPQGSVPVSPAFRRLLRQLLDQRGGAASLARDVLIAVLARPGTDVPERRRELTALRKRTGRGDRVREEVLLLAAAVQRDRIDVPAYAAFGIGRVAGVRPPRRERGRPPKGEKLTDKERPAWTVGRRAALKWRRKFDRLAEGQPDMSVSTVIALLMLPALLGFPTTRATAWTRELLRVLPDERGAAVSRTLRRGKRPGA